MQELGKMLTILASDPGDERSRHDNPCVTKGATRV
jgi:hypothetical protein